MIDTRYLTSPIEVAVGLGILLGPSIVGASNLPQIFTTFWGAIAYHPLMILGIALLVDGGIWSTHLFSKGVQKA